MGASHQENLTYILNRLLAYLLSLSFLFVYQFPSNNSANTGAYNNKILHRTLAHSYGLIAMRTRPTRHTSKLASKWDNSDDVWPMKCSSCQYRLPWERPHKVQIHKHCVCTRYAPHSLICWLTFALSICMLFSLFLIYYFSYCCLYNIKMCVCVCNFLSILYFFFIRSFCSRIAGVFYMRRLFPSFIICHQ